MMSLKKSPLVGCLMLLLMVFSKQSKAVVGAMLNYQYLSANQYQLTLSVYRLCSDPLPANIQTLDYSSLSCGASGSITIGLDTSHEISGINASLYTQSSCNGGTHLGLELFVYRDTIVFPQTCIDWLVSWTSCCRSSSITNLSTTGSPIYVAARINSSGRYSLNSFFNIDYYCAADSMRENRFIRQAISGEEDSLLFNFSCPMQGANNCLSHATGMSVTQPFFTHSSGAVQLDRRTGEVNFHTQPGQSQIASMGMTVYQMHHGDTVGYLQYDLPMIILDSLCNTPAEVISIRPVHGVFDTLSNLMYFCHTNTNIIEIILHDPDGDTIVISSAMTNLNQIWGGNATLILQGTAPYRPDSVKLFVQVAGPIPMPNLYLSYEERCRDFVTIGVSGYGGPSPLASSIVIELGCVIYEIRATTSQTTLCPYTSHQIQLNTSLTQPSTVSGVGSYHWTQLSGPPVLFSNDTIPNPIVTVPAAPPSSSPITLQVSHVADVDTLMNFICTSYSDLITLTYDTSSVCTIPYPKAVEGRVVDDLNQNCMLDSLENQHRRTVLIAFENGLDTFYYATDSLSHYEAYLDTGTYTIHLLNNNPIWTGCPLTQTVSVDTNYTVQVIDFVMEPIQACPQLEVTVKPIGIDWFCTGQDMAVSYVNTGTVDAINAFVDVELDSGMLLLSSALPILSQTANTYRFALDTIAYGFSGQFNIRVRPNCQFILGEYFFVQAHLYPDTLCDSLSRFIDVQQSCSLDTARFTISNYSNATSLTTIPYWILENNIIVDTGTIQLGYGQTTTIKYPDDLGTTFRFYQLVLYPYSRDYIASIPISCDGWFWYRNPLFSPNYRRSSISTYYNQSGLPYDPNIKVANPEGYDSLHHYIFPNHPIDYTIHFQNTGTDTAEVVVILDTLSAHLNIGSLDMRGSSHPYTWRVLPYTPSGLHVLEITFDQIMLPDSNINEAASHGFVQYHIEQLADLPNFTRLENSASIYFDSNAPIKTNTTFHTICDSCFAMNITNSSVLVGAERITQVKPNVRLYPNPTDKTLILESDQTIEGFLIYNSLGQLVLQELEIASQQIPISTASLENGTYFISLFTGGKVVNKIFQVLH